MLDRPPADVLVERPLTSRRDVAARIISEPSRRSSSRNTFRTIAAPDVHHAGLGAFLEHGVDFLFVTSAPPAGAARRRSNASVETDKRHNGRVTRRGTGSAGDQAAMASGWNWARRWYQFADDDRHVGDDDTTTRRPRARRRRQPEPAASAEGSAWRLADDALSTPIEVMRSARSKGAGAVPRAAARQRTLVAILARRCRRTARRRERELDMANRREDDQAGRNRISMRGPVRLAAAAPAARRKRAAAKEANGGTQTTQSTPTSRT